MKILPGCTSVEADLDPLVDVINSVTGWEWTCDDFFRGWNGFGIPSEEKL